MDQSSKKQLEELLSRLLDSSLNDAEQDQLTTLLAADPVARTLYHDHMALHALLRWKESAPLEREPSIASQRGGLRLLQARASRSRRGWYFAVGAMATLLLVGVMIWKFLDREAGMFGTGLFGIRPVAVRILEAQGVTPGAWVAGESVALNHLSIASGILRVRIEESGVVLCVLGPAEMTLATAMLAQVSRGQVTTDVGEHGKGFSVVTAQAELVDLGTTFGVDVSGLGTTDVVVFQGMVQVFKDKGRVTPLSTLNEGEAVRVEANRDLARIPNIITRTAPTRWTTTSPAAKDCVITSVRDNFRSPDARLFYEIVPGGMVEGTSAYVARRHLWKGRTAKGLPPYLIGADFVRTFVVDHRKQNLAISVNVSRPAVLYVLFEGRHYQRRWREAGNVELAPQWLLDNFQRTGDKVGLDDAGQLQPGETMSAEPGKGHLVTFDVWKREVHEPGEITLGPPTGSDGWLNWMYGIAARPLESQGDQRKR